MSSALVPTGSGARKTALRGSRKKIFFICGSINQTAQMVQIAAQLPEYDHYFSPYFGRPWERLVARAGLLEGTIMGSKRGGWCLDYLKARGLKVDMYGETLGNDYDLVVTCTDLLPQPVCRGRKVVWVQEGILDPEWYMSRIVRALPFIPLYFAGTTLTGQSDMYSVGCVMSEGYRQDLIKEGISPDKLRVTGIPNFDNCEAYRNNTFPHHGFALVCTSDVRELGGREDRKSFIERATGLSKGKRMIFKLHPNEQRERAEREIREWAPEGTLVFQEGSAEEMIANCDILITLYSSTVFVGMALGKECHSWWPEAELKRLCPVQNGGTSAQRIADICREQLEIEEPALSRAYEPRQLAAALGASASNHHFDPTGKR